MSSQSVPFFQPDGKDSPLSGAGKGVGLEAVDCLKETLAVTRYLQTAFCGVSSSTWQSETVPRVSLS
jgi:hypothetical protein